VWKRPVPEDAVGKLFKYAATGVAAVDKNAQVKLRVEFDLVAI
jgi:hypothetical protein